MPDRLSYVAFVLALTAAVACGDASVDADTGPAVVDSGAGDGGSSDTGSSDSGSAMDTGGATDAGTEADAATDAGADAGTDAGADAGTDAGADADAGSATDADAGMPADGGPLSCTAGSETAIGQLCVTNADTAGGMVTFQVVPMGCLSSSCTIRHTTHCDVLRSGSTFDLTALFCLEPTGGTICSADCNGGGFANCSWGGVEAGTYTATLGGLSVTFTVPSTIPPGGICDGSPF